MVRAVRAHRFAFRMRSAEPTQELAAAVSGRLKTRPDHRSWNASAVVPKDHLVTRLYAIKSMPGPAE